MWTCDCCHNSRSIQPYNAMNHFKQVKQISIIKHLSSANNTITFSTLVMHEIKLSLLCHRSWVQDKLDSTPFSTFVPYPSVESQTYTMI
jgi:hypothetical protein